MLTNNELKQVMGGAVSIGLITAIVRGINYIMDVGRSFGTVIRRLQNGQLC